MKVVIVGGGEIGSLIAEALHRSHGVTVIDQDGERKEVFSHLDVRFLQGNGTDPEDLRAAEVERASAFIACTDNDDVNVLACLAAKGLGAKQTLAFVARQRYIDAFKREGAFESVGLLIDRVLWPQRLLARQIADIVRVPRAIDSARFAAGRISMLEFLLEDGDPFMYTPLAQLELPEGVLAVGAIRGDNFAIPVGGTTFEPGDRVVFMGTTERMKAVQRSFAPSTRSQKVVIVGGGNVGFMVAEYLEPHRYDLTVFEEVEERCLKLAQWLPGVLVLRGDGTDLELLEQERVEDADVMVAVTDDDGKNLLVSLLAKQLGIPKVVTRVGRPRNRRAFMRVGIDSPLTPRAVAVQEVINWLRVDEVEHLATIEDFAEVTEAIYPHDAVGGRVMDLGTPETMLIGAIERGNKVLVPNGLTVVEPGDHLFLVTTPDQVDALEQWLDEQGTPVPARS
ncbi:MAG: Trk system potassium transporter TrkA [Trueperaceae bacterium]|jgi:trk system potassium uptake protein TrkA